uniref:Uncharacterized protein n=1 Tax=Arundo donax TaxID=35708 RepID=A0A0A9G429_ARUDO
MTLRKCTFSCHVISLTCLSLSLVSLSQTSTKTSYCNICVSSFVLYMNFCDEIYSPK